VRISFESFSGVASNYG